MQAFVFQRDYPPLHQSWRDLVLCGLMFLHFPNQNNLGLYPLLNASRPGRVVHFCHFAGKAILCSNFLSISLIFHIFLPTKCKYSELRPALWFKLCYLICTCNICKKEIWNLKKKNKNQSKKKEKKKHISPKCQLRRFCINTTLRA